MLAIYDNSYEPDSLIASAYVSMALEDALDRWTDALVWSTLYNPFEEEIFTCRVVYSFIGVIYYAPGEVERSCESFSKLSVFDSGNQYVSLR